MQDFVYVIHDGLALRGATGDRDDVVLDFGGMVGGHFGILIDADDVTIADLTIRNADEHGVSIQGRDRPMLYNLHILDIGDQLVKVNPAGRWQRGRPAGLLAPGIHDHRARRVHQRHQRPRRPPLDRARQRVVRIRTPGNAPVPTILFWSGSSDTVVERNLLVDCYQGIAFGNASHGPGDHSGGVVRNNMIYASLPHDSVIEMVHADRLAGGPQHGPAAESRRRDLGHGGPLCRQPGHLCLQPDQHGPLAGPRRCPGDRHRQRHRRPERVGSWTPPPPTCTWWPRPRAPSTRLPPWPEVPDDYDGDARPIGPAPDVGADEYGAPPAPNYAVYLPLVLRGWSDPAPTPTVEPTAEPTPPATDLLQPGDLAYRGAFRLPADPAGMGWEWANWGSALTYYPDGDPAGPADGYPGSLFGTGHDWNQYVSEVSIPVPVVSPGKDVNDLNTATTLQPFADIRGGLFG